ncbi:MAG TPA: glutamyl-tRNA reductase [Deltaproteobacteria bacterium]|nr:glutamyl-tRNA reductase [Deltaproteobacteria bacterium]
MNLVIVGLNHRSSPVEIREKVSFPADGIAEPLGRLTNHYGLNEAVIISTCNRVEIVAAVGDMEKGAWQIKGFISDYHGVPIEELDDHLYVHRGEDAVRHLFRVASSLDSMVMGEPQILGQVKEAYSHAVGCKTAGLVMNKLFHKTFSVAKRIRTETRIGASAVSISFAAVELARKIFGSLAGRSVMLVGAGEMAELAARHLLSDGVSGIFVANRTYSRAVEMARGFGGKAIMFREFTHYLKEVDIVIASTGARSFIIRPEEIEGVMRERKQRPMFFIDISVPRNIDPLVNNIDNAYVYDIDDLQGVVEANLRERAREAGEAEAIIDEEIGNFYRWVKSLDVVPTIIALNRRFESIRRAELEKALASMGGLTAKQKKVLDAMSAAIVKKILHAPVTHLKREAHTVEGDFFVEAARRLFDLEEGEEELRSAGGRKR